MGAWSNKPFGNDSALDWLERAALPSANQFSTFIGDTISTVLGNWAGDSDEAEQAIAAIAVVSAAAVEPIGPCHKDAKALISQFGFVPDTRLITNCLLALQIVCYNEASELRELWNDEGSVVSWIKQTEKLSIVLNAALKNGLPTRVPKKQGMPRTLIKLIHLYKTDPSTAIRKKITEKFAEITNFSSAANAELDLLTPLYLAAWHGFLEEAQSLLDRGADPNGDGNCYAGPSPSERPFDAACLNGHLELAELLRTRGARIFIALEQDDGVPLCDHHRYLLAVGGELKKKSDTYWVALVRVCRDGSVAALEYLRSLGATLDETGYDGRSLAHWAAQGGNLPILEYLSKEGLDLDRPVGHSGPSPLHNAVENLNFEATKFLLDKGANPNRINRFYGNHPWTPLTAAIWKDRRGEKLVELLRRYGAKTIEELEGTSIL
jgi:ankyrin repeat protein